ncbi:MAG: peptide chain release factor 3 [Leptospiraceae bacterium]|nr:peptide chain release factor 3 [Leptospiraceae bacterium]
MYEKEVLRRRAFAIIAHPDAGKTTLTEKLLLYSGAIHLAGHVRAKKERRKTRSDWMTLEQERGISISTAAMQFVSQGYVVNLLDTPGHQDFSEDTYRTLMAVDSAVMVLDAARGVEPQTIKLFHICRERKIPIFTFINKMDLPALDPFALLDNIESVLKIEAVPLCWPMGSGRDFKGFYDLERKQVHSFEKSVTSAYPACEQITGLDDPRLQEIMGEEIYRSFREGVEIASSALPPFDYEKFLRGEQTPVFFGSALTNFGVEHLLKEFLRLSPSPQRVITEDGKIIEPASEKFSAFVFKLQANMNKAHRDRVAFVRILSGRFERGMSVFVPRLNKEIKLTSPVAFFGQERNTIDEAYAGDIIGLINPGLYRLGDLLCTGEPFLYNPLPRFAPELFARLILQDTSKAKQFRKAIHELSEEGVIQLFNIYEQTPIVGVVGQLQFDVLLYRLQDEYAVPARLESLPFQVSRWTHEKHKEKFSRYDMLVYDSEGNLVVLFENEFRLKSFQEKYPEVELFSHPPQLALAAGRK